MILENSFGKEMMMAKIQCMAKVTEVSVLAEGIVSMRASSTSASGVAKSENRDSLFRCTAIIRIHFFHVR